MIIHRPLRYSFVERAYVYPEEFYEPVAYEPYDPGVWVFVDQEAICDPKFTPQGAVVTLEVTHYQHKDPRLTRHRVPYEFLLILDTEPMEVWDMILDSQIRPYCCVSYECREARAVREAFKMLL